MRCHGRPRSAHGGIAEEKPVRMGEKLSNPFPGVLQGWSEGGISGVESLPRKTAWPFVQRLFTRNASLLSPDSIDYV